MCGMYACIRLPCCLSPNASQVCRFLEIPIQQYLARRWSLTLFWRRRTDTVRSRYDRVGLYRLAKYTSWLARVPVTLCYFCWIPIRSLCCMPAGHGGWRSSLVLLPRCLWSRSRFDGPLWGRWPRIGWYLWVSDPGSAGTGHRCSSSGVGRHDDMSCRLSQVSLLFYCNIFSKYVYLCCVCEMGAYEHIHVHVYEILVWNWVSPGWLFP